MKYCKDCNGMLSDTGFCFRCNKQKTITQTRTTDSAEMNEKIKTLRLRIAELELEIENRRLVCKLLESHKQNNYLLLKRYETKVNNEVGKIPSPINIPSAKAINQEDNDV